MGADPFAVLAGVELADAQDWPLYSPPSAYDWHSTPHRYVGRPGSRRLVCDLCGRGGSASIHKVAP